MVLWQKWWRVEMIFLNNYIALCVLWWLNAVGTWRYIVLMPLCCEVERLAANQSGLLRVRSAWETTRRVWLHQGRNQSCRCFSRSHTTWTVASGKTIDHHHELSKFSYQCKKSQEFQKNLQTAISRTRVYDAVGNILISDAVRCNNCLTNGAKIRHTETAYTSECGYSNGETRMPSLRISFKSFKSSNHLT